MQKVQKAFMQVQFFLYLSYNLSIISKFSSLRGIFYVQYKKSFLPSKIFYFSEQNINTYIAKLSEKIWPTHLNEKWTNWFAFIWISFLRIKKKIETVFWNNNLAKDASCSSQFAGGKSRFIFVAKYKATDPNKVIGDVRYH